MLPRPKITDQVESHHPILSPDPNITGARRIEVGNWTPVTANWRAFFTWTKPLAAHIVDKSNICCLISDQRQDERGQRIVHHRLVVDQRQRPARCGRERMDSSCAAAS